MNRPTLITSVRPGDRLRIAAGAFGLRVRKAPRAGNHHHGPAHAAAEIAFTAATPGRTVLIAGPSGSGKSTALAILHKRINERPGAHPHPAVVRIDHARPALRAEPVIDLVPGTVAEACKALARAGLGEAMLLGRLPAELSEGQRLRLRLAIAMRRAEQHRAAKRPGAWLLIDEAWSTLDEPTAASIAEAMRKWARSTGVRIVSAGAPERLAALLSPDALVYIDSAGRTARIERGKA